MDYKIAQRLQEYRKAHHLSQEELADKLGVSRQAVSKWERGESSPDTDNLLALAKLYHTSIDCMLGEEVVDRQENKPTITPKEEEKEEEETSLKVKLITTIVSSCTALVVTVIYFILSFCLNNWGQTWLIFMLVPIVGSLCDAIVKKNARNFAYPVLVAGIYILVGLFTQFWHPFWILFLTIPLYYMILDILENYKKAKKEK